MQPLNGIRVLDFSTLLPGPLAGLLLAEAGADVIKIERPGMGDEMRTYAPKLGPDSTNFALLNRGKRSIALDLKAPGAIERVAPLLKSADALIEQFRPGVMERLGLGYEAVSAINPRLVYCSISGFGQSGPRRDMAAHDLNYMAIAGLLSLTGDANRAPTLPPVLVADIAAGAYPAVINILLALMQRDRTGRGRHLDIAMSDNLMTLAYWGLGKGFSGNGWPRMSDDLVSGGSARYQIYRTADGGYLTAAPIEQRFWTVFCDLIELEPEYRDDARDSKAAIAAVAAKICTQTTEHWRRVFADKDACCAIVASLGEAVADAHVEARGLFDFRTSNRGQEIPALPVPIERALRDPKASKSAPALGADNDLLQSGR